MDFIIVIKKCIRKISIIKQLNRSGIIIIHQIIIHMIADNNELWNDKDSPSEQNNTDKPNAYRVDDEDNREEKDLERTYLFGEGKMKSTDAPGMEGQGMG